MSNPTNNASPIVSRKRSDGAILTVSIVNGYAVASLNGKPVARPYVSIGKGQMTPLGQMTHAIGECGILATEAAVIDAALAAHKATPDGQRAALVSALGDGIAYPGSREWTRDEAARKALAAFDLAHPEVLATSVAAHASSCAASGVGRGGGL